MVSWVLAVFAALFGFVIGSFLNVVIHRGPVIWGLMAPGHGRHGNLLTPGSYCPSCQIRLRFFNLIPIASFIFQRGRCAHCAAPIALRYFLVEAAGGAAALIAYLVHGLSPEAAALAVFLWTLIALAAIDAETRYLPDALTLPLIAGGLGVSAGALFVPFTQALIGAAVGYLAFRTIGAAFRLWRGIDGLGQGDAKLLAAIGAWGGWMALAPTVFIAALLGLAGAGMSALLGRAIKRDTEIPFGPALAAAGALIIVMQTAGLGPAP